jgi:hypothetical protein
LIKENIQELLNSLSDRELAYFSKYRRYEFMAESQKKIQSELEKRNITESRIESLINIVESITNENCPRCPSENFIDIKDVELRTSNYASYEVEINSRKCRICAYNA